MSMHIVAKTARAALSLLCGLILAGLCTACSPASNGSQPAADKTALVTVELTEQCSGDGAVQTWLLLPLDPARSDLLDAYAAGQVIDFQAVVTGADDSPALQPHRRLILRELAAGLTLLLDYQGDAPPLIPGQPYRVVAWADLVPQPPASGESTPGPTPTTPDSRSYALQVYDSVGLLFVGLTDADLRDDPLAISLENERGECPAAPTQNSCVQTRRVLPLRIGWGASQLVLYPGENGELSHQGARYLVEVFRNRQSQLADPPCPGYYESQRSLRVSRIEPPPLPAPLPITPTLTITSTAPLTIPLPSP